MAKAPDTTKTLRPAAKLPEPAKKVLRPAAAVPVPKKAGRAAARLPEPVQKKPTRAAAPIPKPLKPTKSATTVQAPGKTGRSADKTLPQKDYKDPELDENYDPVAAAKELEESRAAWVNRDPLDTARFMEVLPAMDLPKHVPSKDYTTAVSGWGSGAIAGKNDNLTDLTVAEEVRLLAENNIFLSTRAGETALGLGAMAAYVVGSSLVPSDRLAVRFKKLALRTPDVTRLDNSGISYAEFESNIQRQSITKSNLSVGMPGIFKVDASYSQSSATSIYEHKVTIHFQASQIIPKAKVVLEEEDIELDAKFVEKITAACDAGTGPESADKLLVLFEDYGQFVPTTILLGGRITLHTSTQLSDRAHFQAAEQELKVAADAELKAKNIRAGGGAGHKNAQKDSTTTVVQNKLLQMELKGGNENLASSLGEVLGTQWMSSLAPYIVWRTIGFTDKSLVPVINFLEKTLRERCLKILRNYFLDKLGLADTEIAGNESKDYFPDLRDDRNVRGDYVDFSRVKRIVDFTVNSDANIDGLSWTYERYGDGDRTTTEKTAQNFGAHRGTKRGPIALRADEEITGIEAWVDSGKNGYIRRVAFVTNRTRHPNVGFYGEGEGGRFLKIEVPRVRGWHGRKEGTIHGIGLKYLQLAENTKSRAFLLEMEPYLFPDRDYGIVK